MTADVFVPLGADVDRDARRARVVAAGGIGGIDFVEVLGDRRTLLVRLLPSGPGAARFSARTVRITRGGPAPAPTVLWARAAGSPDDPPAVTEALLGDDPAAVLVVSIARAGGAAPHRLHLLDDDGSEPPEGFDPVLCEMPFTFAPETASDPRTPPPGDAAPTGTPLTDYLARDADALRARLLDRFAALVPGWDDRSPADVVVMMLELFAALGDRLAYWQDAVGVEAFLGTARRRASIRRHARLLDYDLGEGCAARVWLAFETPRTVRLPAHRPVTDHPLPAGSTAADAMAAGGVVFETCPSGRTVSPARNAVELYAWGDAEHELPAGARSAFLLLPTGAPDPGLRRGDVLVLCHLGPDDPSGTLTPFARCGDGDPALRFAVRLDADPIVRRDPLAGRRMFPTCELEGRTVLEIHWAEDDALPRPLPVTARDTAGAPVAQAVALANVLPADEGASLPPEALLPPAPTPGVPFRPRLRSGTPAWVDTSWDRPASGVDDRSATVLARPDATAAVPALTLTDARRTWEARRDLLGSGGQDPHVVVEPDGRGGASLRFGDGVHGRVPGAQVPLVAQYRIGRGAEGNVAAGSLATLLAPLPAPDAAPDPLAGVAVRVWNPLPAAGGADPEDPERARRLAPAGLSRQERAVTSADYARTAVEAGGVQRGAARRRWNGSWHILEVAVDPQGTEALSPGLRRRIDDRLDRRRTAGTDVAVTGPAYAALHIELIVYVRAGHTRLAVQERVRDALSARDLGGGRRGFFHPDRFTFGEPVHLSDVIVTVADVPGVERVGVTTFARLTGPAPEQTLAAEVIPVRPLEVARCDSDPDRPDAGMVELTMVGGT